MTQLTKTQLGIAADMLDLAYEEFSNHNYTSFAIENTPQNMEFVQEMIKASERPSDRLRLSDDEQMIYFIDWQAMAYCRDLLRKAAEAIAE